MPYVITGLRQQKRNPRRVNLYLDGEFSMALSLEVVQDYGLRRGQELAEADLEALRRAEGKRRALQDAVRFLSYRPRSRAELEQHLRERGKDDETVQEVLGKLLDAGLVDDRAFARSWVEMRQASRPRGREGLRAELRRKGIPPAVIEEVLAEALDGQEEAELALEIARTRARSLSGLERPAFFRRLRAYLVRRGFSLQTADSVVRRVWTEQHAEPLEPEET